MNPEVGNHFESIESAHDYVGLLSETINEVRQEIDADIERALDSQSPRRMQALRMVSYNLEKLAVHMKKSCRILNDLRSLRRLMFEERTAAAVSKPAALAKTEVAAPPARAPAVPVPPLHAPRPATVVGSIHRPGGITAA